MCQPKNCALHFFLLYCREMSISLIWGSKHIFIVDSCLDVNHVFCHLNKCEVGCINKRSWFIQVWADQTRLTYNHWHVFVTCHLGEVLQRTLYEESPCSPLWAFTFNEDKPVSNWQESMQADRSAAKVLMPCCFVDLVTTGHVLTLTDTDLCLCWGLLKASSDCIDGEKKKRLL